MVKVSNSFFKAAAFRAVILGAPGSGKGTISSRIVKAFGVTHISTGDKLRENALKSTELGKQVKKYINEGILVPDETMINIVTHEIETSNGANYLLDGFPRTLVQAEMLQKQYPINFVLNLIVPHSVIIERVKNRWVHLKSGRVYNIGFNDPKIPGKDDETGESLSQRIDDRPEIVAKRLNEYSAQVKPVIEYYKKLGILKTFEGSSTDELWPKIQKFINQHIKS
ncbi:GTP:AMP phosphotransferase AK3, mitochondrial isoform X2 [Chelonus insularis]|uniref:GTP:AMP phosphotransferase AK3, mitochondrial isoform X2 n=1 Tax=Chelonus insularis TaxID=460826 RepID=UPI00158A86B0|nr:GTP:AMP phosphotransferase AK3, mitochondrial isoform X2 [Chelonus insularis]